MRTKNIFNQKVSEIGKLSFSTIMLHFPYKVDNLRQTFFQFDFKNNSKIVSTFLVNNIFRSSHRRRSVRIGVLSKFRKIHRKTPVPESLF